MSVYAEEHTGLKDTITFEFTGSNLDKKDLFSESDPFFTLSRLNPDGSDTIVYRSDYLKDEPNPSWPEVTITSDKLCNGDWNRRLRVSCTHTQCGKKKKIFRENSFTVLSRNKLISRNF